MVNYNNMKKYILPLFGVAGLLFLLHSCAKIAPAFTVKSKAGSLSAVSVTFADGTGGFTPTTSEPYDSVLEVDIPWYYPDGTTKVTSTDSLIITGTIPNSSYLSPAFGLTSFNSPKTYTVRAQDGSTKQYTIKVVRKKSSKAEITSFTLKEANISGVVAKTNVIIPFTNVDLSNQTATVELSNYATISPDPSVARDYTDSVKYTVTAQDGTQVVYTVKLGTPVKLAKGFGTVKTLWTKSSGDLGFVDYQQISIAVSGDYFVLPNSNEWASGSSAKYYSTKTGAYAGDFNVTGVDGLYAVANDTSGHIVGINNLYAGNNVCLYKWDNATAAPVLLARSSGWASVASAFYGRKISVYGDLTGNAVIMATTDGSNTGAANNVLQWRVRNGAIVSQDPTVITYSKPYDYVAKAVPTGPLGTEGYYFCSNSPSFMDYVNGTGNSPAFSFASDWISSPRGSTPALTYFEFNNAKYAAVTDASAYSSAMHIFNVTDPSLITTSSSSSSYNSFHVYDGSSGYVGCVDPNLNVTGDIAVGPVSADGFTRTVYFLVTNGGVVAYQLSCLDLSGY